MGMKCVYLFIISSLDYHELVSTCEENVPGYCVTTSDGGINSGNNRRITRPLKRNRGVFERTQRGNDASEANNGLTSIDTPG